MFNGTREKRNRAATASAPNKAGPATTVEMCELCRIDGLFERAQSILVSFRLNSVENLVLMVVNQPTESASDRGTCANGHQRPFTLSLAGVRYDILNVHTRQHMMTNWRTRVALGERVGWRV
jgi:hypothetical protein